MLELSFTRFFGDVEKNYAVNLLKTIAEATEGRIAFPPTMIKKVQVAHDTLEAFKKKKATEKQLVDTFASVGLAFFTWISSTVNQVQIEAAEPTVEDPLGVAAAEAANASFLETEKGRQYSEVVDKKRAQENDEFLAANRAEAEAYAKYRDDFAEDTEQGKKLREGLARMKESFVESPQGFEYMAKLTNEHLVTTIPEELQKVTGGTYDDFMSELKADASAQGPEAVAELQAFDKHFTAEQTKLHPDSEESQVFGTKRKR